MHAAHSADVNKVRDRIAVLQSEHHDLDRLIARLNDVHGVSDVELQRLKKRKLKVKDTLMLLQLQLEHDHHPA